MIKKLKIKIQDIPTLFVFKDEIDKAGKRGAILFFHGLTVSKEENEKELKSLAKCGFLAVGIDNVGHGERHDPAFIKRFVGGLVSQNRSKFIDAIIKTADEVPVIIDYLIEIAQHYRRYLTFKLECI